LKRFQWADWSGAGVWRRQDGVTLAVTGATIGLVTLLGIWTHYVSGAYFLLAISVLAWRYGFRAGFLSMLISVAAYWPLMVWVDARAIAGPDRVPLRLINTVILALAISWFCENLHAARRKLLGEQQRLRESETFHRVIADLAADFAWHARVTRDGRLEIDSATSGLQMLLGYSIDDFKGRDWASVVHQDDQMMVRAAIERAIRGERTDGVARTHTRDGRVITVHYRIHPEIAPGAAQATGLIGAVRDITVDRMREDAWHRAKEEAERRADEAEEARAALKDRERRLREEARLKDEFLATLAHELRNPLAPIRNVPDMLRAQPLSAESENAVAILERQLAQMVRLIDDLLDVSRITRGHLELRRSRVDLMGAVHNAVETSRPLFESAGVRLTISAPDVPVTLDADPTRLAQIVQNLLNNAAKYTPAGGAVALTVTPLDGKVTLSVRDSGIGIAADDLERVFELFVQIDRHSRRSQTGLGIGLPLVKQMAELHGGTVSVWSDGPGRGSEFVVTLPLAESAAPGAPAEPVPAPAAATPRRVLIVDDSEDGANSLAYVLEMRGHTVKTAYEGRAALTLAAEFRPEVFFVDIGMPGMSGYDVARAVRREPWGRGMTLVALTGWGQPDDRHRSFEAGFDRHLVKPAELDEVDRLLRGGRAHPSSTTIEVRPV
jgi:PAS domain S-box-containing protein